MKRGRWFLLLGLWGCLDHELAPESEDTFIALQRDFAPFLDWPEVMVGETPITPDGHLTGPRYAFLNEKPASGGTSFPVGTIIVKTAQTGNPIQWEIHAMVKRGGGFNVDGAVGWEWFDLALTEELEPVIRWRGPTPPDGESYGGQIAEEDSVMGDCNTCHLAAASNDFVMSAPLNLDTF